jgi:hypothetical protein
LIFHNISLLFTLCCCTLIEILRLNLHGESEQANFFFAILLLLSSQKFIFTHLRKMNYTICFPRQSFSFIFIMLSSLLTLLLVFLLSIASINHCYLIYLHAFYSTCFSKCLCRPCAYLSRNRIEFLLIFFNS